MTKTRMVPIRRGQLIRPFGVGSLVVGPDGTSLITAGLDQWYKREDGESRNVHPAEFKVTEWRLQSELGVSHFRLPPDFRLGQGTAPTPNTGLRIPMLRFPQWHYCPSCRRLRDYPLSHRETPECFCRPKGRRQAQMLQVRFVAICGRGHLFDFPWREWVHRGPTSCDAQMRLRATGLVECECKSVGARSLQYVTQAKSLLPQGCPGTAPWLGDDERRPCDELVRAGLRSSSNIYFANVRSSIYVPRTTRAAPPELVQRLEEPPLSDQIDLLKRAGQEPGPAPLRGSHALLLEGFSDEEIAQGLAAVRDSGSAGDEAPSVAGDDRETAFRRDEFSQLKSSVDHLELKTRPVAPTEYDPPLSNHASLVTLVEKLRATEVFTGFSRVEPEEQFLDSDGDAATAHRRDELPWDLLWKRPPPRGERWLPANVIYGEGIFIELDEENVRAWEEQEVVQERGSTLRRNYEAARRRRPPPWISPRYTLIHTLAHLLINQLTYEAGYSSAALRERLYVSTAQEAPMAAVLIYTAAGDADGTLGGLVRLGRPEHLGRVITEALEGADWCSADPVCAELAETGGQGPDSCNLAACHNCALLPETACESGNRFLDRALVKAGVADVQGGAVGFFG